MFISRARSAHVANRLSILLITFLILQAILPSSATTVMAAPLVNQTITEPTALTQPTALTEPWAVEQDETPSADVPAADEVPAPNLTSLEVYLTLTLDRALLLVEETATLTLTVVSGSTSEEKDLQLSLDLPTGIATTSGEQNQLRWTIPTLAAGQMFQQQVQIIINQPKQTLTPAVLTFAMQVDAPGRAPQMVT